MLNLVIKLFSIDLLYRLRLLNRGLRGLVRGGGVLIVLGEMPPSVAMSQAAIVCCRSSD
jgi:hypothetical protein